MSVADPARIFDPKPPDSDGHRKAMTVVPKPARPSAKNAVMPRLKNCRRVIHLQKFPHPQVLLLHYLQGSTAIEAYWKSVAWPQQGVFIGEPLSAPFARP
jgi:hypothetical protein